MAEQAAIKQAAADTKKPETDLGAAHGLRYEEFIAPLIASVQELAAQNKAFKAEMTALRDELSALKRKEA